MRWPSWTRRVPIGGFGLLLLSAATACGQEYITVEYPFPIPYYIPPGSEAVMYGAVDAASTMPTQFYRPFDNLTPRPGADAMGAGGAYLALASGPLAMGWNPAGLASMRERAMSIDGFVLSSSGEMSGLPDTIFIEGQPPFGIENYEDRLGGVNGFGFAGIAGPLAQIGSRPLVAGLAYRRHTEVAYGTESILEMQLVDGTGFPLIIGLDNQERGSINSYTLGLAYEVISTEALSVALGATGNILQGRHRGESSMRLNITGFDPANTTYRMDYKGFATELGAQAQVSEYVRLGAWVGLPYTLKARDGRYYSASLIAPEAGFGLIFIADLADYDLEMPMGLSGGVAIGPIKGIELTADINHRPWSEAEIKYPGDLAFTPTDENLNPIPGAPSFSYDQFEGNLPAEDVTSYHLGASAEFPFFQDDLHKAGLKLTARAGYRNLPLSMRELDLVSGTEPQYLGSQVEGDAVSFGFSLETDANITFHLAMEFQSYGYHKWFLDSPAMGEGGESNLGFSDPYARGPYVDRRSQILRLSSELVF